MSYYSFRERVKFGVKLFAVNLILLFPPFCFGFLLLFCILNIYNTFVLLSQGSRPSASSTPDEWCLYMTVLKELKGVRKELVASQKESTDHCRARKNDMVAHIAEMKAVRDRYEEKINQQDAEIAELQRVVNHYRQELFAQYAESQCTQELYEKEICEITRFYHNKMSASSSAGAPPMPPPRDPPT